MAEIDLTVDEGDELVIRGGKDGKLSVKTRAKKGEGKSSGKQRLLDSPDPGAIDCAGGKRRLTEVSHG